MSPRKVRILALLTLLLCVGPLVGRWVQPSSNDPWPSFDEGAAVLVLSMYAGFLASCRCESDVQAGRPARWAYGWDWTQLVLLLAAWSLLLWVGSGAALAFAGIAGAHLLLFSRQAWLRRRRARAAWTAATVGRAFE